MIEEEIVSLLVFPQFDATYKLSKYYVECTDKLRLRFHNFGDKESYMRNWFAITCSLFPGSKYLVIDLRDHLTVEILANLTNDPESRLKLVPELLYNLYGSGTELLKSVIRNQQISHAVSSVTF